MEFETDRPESWKEMIYRLRRHQILQYWEPTSLTSVKTGEVIPYSDLNLDKYPPTGVVFPFDTVPTGTYVVNLRELEPDEVSNLNKQKTSKL